MDRLAFAIAFAIGSAFGFASTPEGRRIVRFKFRRAMRGMPLTGELFEHRIQRDVRTKNWRHDAA